MAKELYVGHLSEQTTEEDLYKLFSVMGVVTSVHLIVDPESGEFKRCGYVRMLANVDLKEVVETLDGAYLVDKVITVSIAKPQNERPAKAAKTRGARTRPAAGSRPPASRAEKQTRPASAADKRPQGSRSAVAAPKGQGTARPAAKGPSRPSGGPRPAGKGRK